MKKTFKNFLVIGLFSLLSNIGYAGTDTIRNSNGSVIGTVTTESNGNLIFRDDRNHQVGRAQYNKSTNTYTYYNENGSSIGYSKVEGNKTVYRNGNNSHLIDITPSSTEKRVFIKDGKLVFYK